MRERGFEPDFPPAAIAQAGAADSREFGASQNRTDRRDLRNLLWCSIDNDDSRDLDQLSVAESRDGATGILIAIADVDARVGRGSPVDQHAAVNTTSVYTAAHVFSMLPERFSTDLTSLAQDEDRAAVVVDLTVTPDGSVRASDVYRATVRNRARLAYPSVGAWLEGTAPPPAPLTAVPGLEDNLRLQDTAAHALQQSRHERGALTLDTVEGKPVFAGDELRDLTAIGRSRASALIEDFMIAANTATAEFLERHGFSSLRRIVRMPERWPRIVKLAADTGTELPANPDARALERWLLTQRQQNPQRFVDLSLSIVKLLGRGEYVVEKPNEPTPDHFGLAVDDYTHATAPNRRFADLVTQRLVKAALDGGRPPYSESDLDAIARHCMDREDAANRVERQVRKAAAAILLQHRHGEQFDAIVTGVGPKGTWVRVKHPVVEGRLEGSVHGLEVGDHLPVRLVRTVPEKGFIDFERA
ncbi:MAG TPA: RNB domain-containing ribonuclease [Vicinamibacterales bacterium]|nr:RNB domain-containing ribonuclease [Vicinamibacterales bacterium]